MNYSDTIKLAIVDDHNLFRKGLIKLINLGDPSSRYHILFEAENGSDLKDKIDTNNLPDIILLDIDMPDIDGFETASWLNTFYPEIKILVVSMMHHESAIARMLRNGINGYLSKDIEVEDMHNALESIRTKGHYFSDLHAITMANLIRKENPREDFKFDDKVQQFITRLTENERTFLKLACTELTYQQIAEKMHLSFKTIDGYREALFHKFSVRSRVGLAMFALKNNLVVV